ncbi:lipopolysaccharide biosynthesis protein [Bacillus sp. 1P02SD]|uniref:lipopolysaccharide biosynthesis protein n=1 Tax=Bacillus sp. 1P02SD TaxID=3132264 RepID=UPI0039A3BD4E
MRIKNSLNNMFFGLVGQIISLVMGFIVRTIFIYKLGIEYLGIDGLFTSILVMLSLANLGFDTTMIYSLYKPLAEKDYYKIQALMNLYKKAYSLIGLIVLIIGLMLFPFIPHLINGQTTISNINIIYLMFLLNSVMSYYFVYKQSIIIADQQNFIISKIHSLFTIILNFSVIFLLLITGNYLVILFTQISIRIIENIYIVNKANNLYPYIREKNNAKLSDGDKKSFFGNLYAQMLYKISAIVIDGTDNIIISIFIGISSVGIYSNYLLIMGTIGTLISYIFYSITASVGNLVVEESNEKKYFIFRVINLANFWIYGFISISLLLLFNPFITLWLGESFTFEQYIVMAIVLNFFTAGMQNASTTYRETTGLFKIGKYRPIYAAVINIAVSVFLVQYMGVAGVLLGTVISRLCTYFWYDPYVIFKYIFQKSVKVYFLQYLFNVTTLIVSFILTSYLSNFITNGTYWNLVIQGLLCILIPNLLFYLIFRKTNEFQYLLTIFIMIFKKVISVKILRKRKFTKKTQKVQL